MFVLGKLQRPRFKYFTITEMLTFRKLLRFTCAASMYYGLDLICAYSAASKRRKINTVSKIYSVGIGNFIAILPGLDHRSSFSNSIGQVDSLALPLNPSHMDCHTLKSEYPFPCGNKEQMVCLSPAEDKTLKVAATVCWTKYQERMGL